MPGDGNSGGWKVDRHRFPSHYLGSSSALSPPAHVPLFPRHEVSAVCGEHVRGEVVVGDARTWGDVKGTVAVDATSLTMGSNTRDKYAWSIMEALRYPAIRFRIERIENVERGDTTRGTVVGVFQLHGVERAMTVPVKGWPVAGGLRVVGQFQIPAYDMIKVFGYSRIKMGLGTAGKIWKELHMGFDFVLRPASGAT